MRAGPHKVVGKHLLLQLATEGAFTNLQREFILAIVQHIGHCTTPAIARYIVPPFRAEIEVYGCGIILVATNGHHLVTGRQFPIILTIGKVNPVGGIEEAVARIVLVKTLAIRVRELVAYIAVDANIQELAFKARSIVVGCPTDIFVLIIATCLNLALWILN